MGPENFGMGGWWIFPVIMCFVMMFVVFMIFGRGGFRPPWLRGSDSQSGERTDTESALEILKKRYAKGEITKTEFDRMKSDLQ